MRIVIDAASHAVVRHTERVDARSELRQTFCLGVVGQRSGIGHVEIAIVVEHDSFVGKGLSAVRNAGTGAQFLRLHVLKPFATPQGQQQVLLVGRSLEHTRIGQNNGLILIAARHPVNHDAVQLAGVHVLFLHIKIAVGDAVVEDAFRNLKLRILLRHRNHQLRHLHVSAGAYIVLKIKRTKADNHRNEDERTKGSHG